MALIYFDLDDWVCEAKTCEHTSVMPTYDSEEAKGKTAMEVREKWPRFFGVCPDCGQQAILYASFEQYVMGDW